MWHSDGDIGGLLDVLADGRADPLSPLVEAAFGAGAVAPGFVFGSSAGIHDATLDPARVLDAFDAAFDAAFHLARSERRVAPASAPAS